MAKKNVELASALENNEAIVLDVNYSSVDYLKAAEPIFPADAVSSKCKLEREPKVQDGLKQLAELMPELSETFLLLGAWWENKHARREIKNMLDVEAENNGYDSIYYMQEVLRPQVVKLENIQEAINRLLYVTTYFKPRENARVNMIQVNIDGETYELSRTQLEDIRTSHTTRDEQIEAVKSVAKKINKNIEVL